MPNIRVSIRAFQPSVIGGGGIITGCVKVFLTLGWHISTGDSATHAQKLVKREGMHAKKITWMNGRMAAHWSTFRQSLFIFLHKYFCSRGGAGWCLGGGADCSFWYHICTDWSSSKQKSYGRSKWSKKIWDTLYVYVCIYVCVCVCSTQKATFFSSRHVISSVHMLYFLVFVSSLFQKERKNVGLWPGPNSQ
jgi:hypothetical protein